MSGIAQAGERVFYFTYDRQGPAGASMQENGG